MVQRQQRWARRTAAALIAIAVSACGDSPTEPDDGIATIVVTSAVDSILGVGRNASLQAAAATSGGSPIAAQFTWESSNTAVATVSPSGIVQAVSAGNATIVAEAGARQGQLRLRVVNADLPAVTAVIADPIGAHLAAGLQQATQASLQATLAAAASAVSSGNIAALRDAFTSVSAAAESAADPTDRVVLAVFRLLVEHALRLLALS